MNNNTSCQYQVPENEYCPLRLQTKQFQVILQSSHILSQVFLPCTTPATSTLLQADTHCHFWFTFLRSRCSIHLNLPRLTIYITLHHYIISISHLKWPVVHKQLHVIRNTAHRPSTQASYTASRVRLKWKISCAAAQIAATPTISFPRWRLSRTRVFDVGLRAVSRSWHSLSQHRVHFRSQSSPSVSFGFPRGAIRGIYIVTRDSPLLWPGWPSAVGALERRGPVCTEPGFVWVVCNIPPVTADHPYSGHGPQRLVRSSDSIDPRSSAAIGWARKCWVVPVSGVTTGGSGGSCLRAPARRGRLAASIEKKYIYTVYIILNLSVKNVDFRLSYV